MTEYIVNTLVFLFGYDLIFLCKCNVHYYDKRSFNNTKID